MYKRQDIGDSWDSVLSIINYNAKYQDEIVPYVGPGNFNDIDMLIIGNFGLSKDQSKTQMALWSIMAAVSINFYNTPRQAGHMKNTDFLRTSFKS